MAVSAGLGACCLSPAAWPLTAGALLHGKSRQSAAIGQRTALSVPQSMTNALIWVLLAVAALKPLKRFKHPRQTADCGYPLLLLELKGAPCLSGSTRTQHLADEHKADII